MIRKISSFFIVVGFIFSFSSFASCGDDFSRQRVVEQYKSKKIAFVQKNKDYKLLKLKLSKELKEAWEHYKKEPADFVLERIDELEGSLLAISEERIELYVAYVVFLEDALLETLTH